ncbi:MAG: hypothetical protein H7A25_02675 [Leptospiraceae bacterium]|nr:hypothetical protein [Leptospiraceae bacterium]MCP5498782.1 hypothetical protein [Leptospiraceae bacterium]
MKFVLIWNIILMLLTGYRYYAVNSRSNIEYAEGVNISLKEDSRTGRRPIYFFGTLRSRTPSGGGFGFGK